MKLTFVNVGYGEAILLEWEESGHTFTALIDGGSSEEREYQARSSERIPICKKNRNRAAGSYGLYTYTRGSCGRSG